MGTFTESVTMECSPDGEPVRMWWRGLCHEIVAKPQSWYQRRPWWQDHTSLRPGEGVGYVDTQIWRLQVVRDGEPGILTMDVLLYRPSLRWRVIKVHPGWSANSPKLSSNPLSQKSRKPSARNSFRRRNRWR
ncbi:hypothetical protein NHF46_12235 [Arthrobacter alpinus]|nr:hypothetical protein [Arthrobacter alpinus]